LAVEVQQCPLSSEVGEEEDEGEEDEEEPEQL